MKAQYVRQWVLPGLRTGLGNPEAVVCVACPWDGCGVLRGGRGREALEGKGPQRRPQRRFYRRLEEVAEAVGGSYKCR